MSDQQKPALFSITDQQRLAVEALLSGSTDVDTAKAAGCHRDTVRAWRTKDEDFQSALNQGRAEIAERLRRRILNRCDAAVEILDKVMHTGEDEGNRVRAAARILDLAPEDVQPKMAVAASLQGPTTIIFEPAKP